MTLVERFSPLFVRVVLLVPLVLSLISAVLTAVTVAAGTSPGSLEELAIFKVDLSRLNVATGLTPERFNVRRPRRDVLDERALVDDLLGALPGRLGGSSGGASDLVDLLLRGTTGDIQNRLGLPEWFSVHPRTLCNGFFNNARDSNSGVFVRSCTEPGRRVNSLAEAAGLDGPLRNIGATIPLPRVLNESSELSLDTINTIMILLTVVFISATVLNFLSALATAGAVIVPGNNLVVSSNTILAATASTLVVIGYAVSFIAAAIFANRFNRMFQDFQIVSQLGPVFLGVGIAAMVLSLTASTVWTILFIVHYRGTLRILYKMTFARSRPIAEQNTKVY